MYPGFERDVLKTVTEYFQRLRQPLLTFHLYEVFVNILSEWTVSCVRESCIGVHVCVCSPAEKHFSFVFQVCCRSRRWPLKHFKSAVCYCRHRIGDSFSFCSVSWLEFPRINNYLHLMTLFPLAHWYTFFYPLCVYCDKYVS